MHLMKQNEKKKELNEKKERESVLKKSIKPLQ